MSLAFREPLLCACGDARAAVVLALEAVEPKSREASRLFKLLSFMDRLLFARTPPSDDGDAPSLHTIVSHRLHLFWRGAWQELWADSEAGAQVAGTKAKSSRRAPVT